MGLKLIVLVKGVPSQWSHQDAQYLRLFEYHCKILLNWSNLCHIGFIGALRRLKSPETQLLVAKLIQANSKEIIERPHYWPSVGGITGVFTSQRASNTESASVQWRLHDNLPLWPLRSRRQCWNLSYSAESTESCLADSNTAGQIRGLSTCLAHRGDPSNLQTIMYHRGPLARYVKLCVVHAPGMPETFSPPPTSEETAS